MKNKLNNSKQVSILSTKRGFWQFIYDHIPLEAEFKKRWLNKYTRAGFFLGAILGALFGMYMVESQKVTIKDVGQIISTPVVGVKAEKPQVPCDYDPITYIRCRGEELGYSNKVITTAIRIARAESNFRPLVKNPSSTATGIFQFINSTWHRYCAGKNVYDYKDNIDCFYKLYAEQTERYSKKGLVYDFNDWDASRHAWEE